MAAKPRRRGPRAALAADALWRPTAVMPRPSRQADVTEWLLRSHFGSIAAAARAARLPAGTVRARLSRGLDMDAALAPPREADSLVAALWGFVAFARRADRTRLGPLALALRRVGEGEVAAAVVAFAETLARRAPDLRGPAADHPANTQRPEG